MPAKKNTKDISGAATGFRSNNLAYSSEKFASTELIMSITLSTPASKYINYFSLLPKLWGKLADCILFKRIKVFNCLIKHNFVANPND